MRVMERIALLAGLFGCVSVAALQAQTPAVASPAVSLTITLPDGQARQLSTHESGLVTVTVGTHEYGFRPTMFDDQGNRLTITIFDMGSATDAVREIGEVEVKGGGPAVPSKTTPIFKVQASKAARGSIT